MKLRRAIAPPNTAVSDYATLWGIETLFGCLKSRSFCLESTHLCDTKRYRKLLVLLTLAYVGHIVLVNG